MSDKVTVELQAGRPDDLSHSGSIVDKAIEYMVDQKIAPISIASALLGGALGLLARTMDDRAIAGILRNALHSVESGELSEVREQLPGGAVEAEKRETGSAVRKRRTNDERAYESLEQTINEIFLALNRLNDKLEMTGKNIDQNIAQLRRARQSA